MARYIPGNVPQEAAQLATFLRLELEKLSSAMATQDAFLWLETLYAEPTKYREGMLVKADGVVFNPGSGPGVYVYKSGAWSFLGGFGGSFFVVIARSMLHLPDFSLA
jgi:hypothetical protein